MPRSDTAFAAAAAALLLTGLVLGFRQLGGRTHQRGLRADATRVNDLGAIAVQIHNEWNSSRDENQKIPDTLADLNHLKETTRVRTSDPITGTWYEYMPDTGSQYQLCAVFA